MDRILQRLCILYICNSKCLLSYLIRDEVIPEHEVDDPLLPNKSYGKSGSLIDELIQGIDHDSLLYCSDNVTLYATLEEVTRNSIYLKRLSSVKSLDSKRLHS